MHYSEDTLESSLDLKKIDACEKRIFWSMPSDVRSVLSEDQMLRLLKAVRPNPSPHIFALQASIMGLTRRYYVALFFGLDQRNIEQLREEGQLDPIPVSIVFFIVLAVVATLTVCAVAFTLYLLKSWLGIDVFDGPSPLHELICS